MFQWHYGYIILCLIFFQKNISSQERIRDAAMRLTFTTKYNLNNKSSFWFRSRILQTENYIHTKRIAFDVGYWYKINARLKLSFHYMYRLNGTADFHFTPKHRYYIRADYRYFFNKYWELHSRTIFQHTTHRFVTDIDDNHYAPYSRTDVRERVGITYNLSSESNVYLQDEIMYTVSDIPIELKRNRIYLGYEKEINDKWDTKIYFVIQSSFHKRNSPNYHYFIIGWDWIFKWN